LRLWWMQSEAFRFEKNRASIVLKPSTHQLILSFYWFSCQNMSYSKKYRNIMLIGAHIRKTIRWIRIYSPFWLKPSKITSCSKQVF